MRFKSSGEGMCEQYGLFSSRKLKRESRDQYYSDPNIIFTRVIREEYKPLALILRENAWSLEDLQFALRRSRRDCMVVVLANSTTREHNKQEEYLDFP